MAQVPGPSADGAWQPVCLPPLAPDQILLLQEHRLCLHAGILPVLLRLLRRVGTCSWLDLRVRLLGLSEYEGKYENLRGLAGNFIILTCSRSLLLLYRRAIHAHNRLIVSGMRFEPKYDIDTDFTCKLTLDEGLCCGPSIVLPYSLLQHIYWPSHNSINFAFRLDCVCPLRRW